ncbi:MAG: hypothetical protein AAGE65_06540 [Planctomycetota bacterium]
MHTTRINVLIVSIIAAALLTGGCEVHHRVQHVKNNQPPSKDGVIYSLPKTQMTVAIPVSLTKKKPGRFFTTPDPSVAAVAGRPFSDQMNEIISSLVQLGIIKPDMAPVLKNKTFEARNVKIGKATFSTGPIWNEELVFLIEWPSKASEARTLSLALNEAGFMTTSSSKARDQTLDVAIKAAETTASIAGKAIGFGTADDYKEGNDVKFQGRYAEAKRAIDRIKTIRERRRGLILPANPSEARLDKESLETRIALLAEEEKKLIQFFLATDTDEWNAIYRLTPSIADIATSMDLFRVLTIKGSGGQGDDQGLRAAHDSRLTLLTPIPPAFRDSPRHRGAGVLHNIAITSLRDYTTWPDESQAPTGQTLGYRYRMPGQAEVVYRIIKPGQSIADSDHKARWAATVAQFGPVRALPTSVGTGDSTISITLHEAHGSLKSVSVDSVVTAAGQLEALKTGVGGVIDTVAALPSDPTELERLTAENAVLKALKENRDLKSDLGVE